MLTKTSKEVLLHALHLAGVQNIGFLDFYNIIAMVNNEYRRIYENIATTEDGYYDKEYICSGSKIYLPEDCWIVKRVIAMGAGGKESFDIPRSAGKTTVSGQYEVRDNILYLNGYSSDIKIIYAPKPKTLTIPEDPIETLLDKNNIDLAGSYMTERYFYYMNTDDSLFHEYDLENGVDVATEKAPYESNDYRYLNGTLTIDNITKDYLFIDEDGSSTNITEHLSQGKTIDYVVVSDPYMAVTYTDKTIKIFNGFECADYNIFAYKGKGTYGKVIGIDTNDYTGKGLLFLNDVDNKIYYCSFVPDTVLDYPEQADFSLLEWQLAANFSQMAGTESEWILDNLESARVDFDKQLKRIRGSVMRINNVRGGRYYGFR